MTLLEFTETELFHPACQILQKHSDSLLELVLPVTVVQRLYDSFDEFKGESLSSDSLRAFRSIVYKSPNKLRVLARILLNSENTAYVGRNILREYGKF